MKIQIRTSAEAEEIEVTVLCGSVTPEVERLVAALKLMDKTLTGKRDGRSYLISAKEVVYIESVERKCFLYTRDCVYETDFRLYELEQQLADRCFFRVSKSVLVNLREILSLKAEYGRRLRITLCGGEQIIASRQYADALKRTLGVKNGREKNNF